MDVDWEIDTSCTTLEVNKETKMTSLCKIVYCHFFNICQRKIHILSRRKKSTLFLEDILIFCRTIHRIKNYPLLLCISKFWTILVSNNIVMNRLSNISVLLSNWVIDFRKILTDSWIFLAIVSRCFQLYYYTYHKYIVKQVDGRFRSLIGPELSFLKHYIIVDY